MSDISPPAAYLEDAVAVLGQRCGGVGGVHLRELLGKVADVQLVPNDRLERGRHLLRSEILPVYFLKLGAIVFYFLGFLQVLMANCDLSTLTSKCEQESGQKLLASPRTVAAPGSAVQCDSFRCICE